VVPGDDKPSGHARVQNVQLPFEIRTNLSLFDIVAGDCRDVNRLRPKFDSRESDWSGATSLPAIRQRSDEAVRLVVALTSLPVAADSAGRGDRARVGRRRVEHGVGRRIGLDLTERRQRLDIRPEAH
jgi:hypothetical protein